MAVLCFAEFERTFVSNSAPMCCILTAFAQSYPQSKLCATCSGLHEVCKAYDAVIVGSDQMWNPQWVMPILDVVLRCLPEKCRRIAYASISALKVARGEQESRTILRSYSYSVRETTESRSSVAWGAQMFSKCLIRHVMDCRFYKQLMVRSRNGRLSLPIFLMNGRMAWKNSMHQCLCVVTGLTKVKGCEPVLGV